MLYFPELYYFFDQKDFPGQKAMLITAKKVAEWSTCYEARLITPYHNLKDVSRQGELPERPDEKQKIIEEVFHWLVANSRVKDLFVLFLDNRHKQKNETAKFDHHDNTCCWVLNLTEIEFKDLQKTWQNENLPSDLFYKEGEEITEKRSPGLIGRFLSKLGFSMENCKIYTPKQWKIKNKL